MSQLQFAAELNNIRLIHQGKTRDTYEARTRPGVANPDRLIVATNRLSTHNVIHQSVIPYKGEVLTALTVFWMVDVLEKAGLSHHIVAYGIRIYDHLPGTRSDYPKDLHHRAIIVRHLDMLLVEFVFRAYLAGSLYDKYYSKRFHNPYGIFIEAGMSVMSEFKPPIFTPTDKSETDEPLRAVEVDGMYPDATMLASKAFDITRAYMRSRGLEQIDGKLEIGLDQDGNPVIGDEHSLDSTRVCELNAIKPGTLPAWFDKQMARDEAERIWGSGQKVPLEFSPKLVTKLSDRYLEGFERIVGMPLGQFWHQRFD